MALNVPRVENSSDQIDVALRWLEPSGLQEEAPEPDYIPA